MLIILLISKSFFCYIYFMLDNIVSKHNYWASFLEKMVCSRFLAEYLVQDRLKKLTAIYNTYS